MNRVLLMIDDASVGGGQKHLLDLATRIDRAKFDVAVATAGDGFLPDRLRTASIPIYPVSLANRPDLRAAGECRRILRAFSPDLVHTHGGTAGFHGRLAANRVGVRTVHTYHGLHYLHFGGIKSFLYRSVDRWLASRTTWIICVSESDRRRARAHRLVREGQDAVVHNGIDVEPFAGVARARQERQGRESADNFLVGTIGRLQRVKGHHYLAEAAAIVARREPTCRFVVHGDGEERAVLERQIEQLGLSERFQLPGSTYDVPAALAKLDLFVLPSLWEGLPLTLLEAMAAGCPVIAARVDGVPEIIRDGENGMLVPPRDPAALADAILRMIGDRSAGERFADVARQTVTARFTLDRMVRETEKVYEAALSV